MQAFFLPMLPADVCEFLFSIYRISTPSGNKTDSSTSLHSLILYNEHFTQVSFKFQIVFNQISSNLTQTIQRGEEKVKVMETIEFVAPVIFLMMSRAEKWSELNEILHGAS